MENKTIKFYDADHDNSIIRSQLQKNECYKTDKYNINVYSKVLRCQQHATLNNPFCKVRLS